MKSFPNPPQGTETFATGGLMLGFVLMMVMDTALGQRMAMVGAGPG